MRNELILKKAKKIFGSWPLILDGCSGSGFSSTFYEKLWKWQKMQMSEDLKWNSVLTFGLTSPKVKVTFHSARGGSRWIRQKNLALPPFSRHFLNLAPRKAFRVKTKSQKFPVKNHSKNSSKPPISYNFQNNSINLTSFSLKVFLFTF